MDEIARRDEEEEEEVTFDPEREAYYKDDPKKALKKYFDREGLTHSMNSSRLLRIYSTSQKNVNCFWVEYIE